MFYRDVLIESRERNAFMSKELQIRNSTVDFLVFTRDAGEEGIEVRIQNGQPSSGHWQPKCWIHLQSRVMFLIKAD